MFIEPTELWKCREVGNAALGSRLVLIGEEPTDMAPPKAFTRRMNIERLIGVQVMIPVMPSPPQHALLRRHRSPECHDELHSSAQAVRTVREVSVIAGRDKEHTDHVQREAKDNVSPRDPGKQRQQRHQMHHKKRDRRHPVHPFIVRACHSVHHRIRV